MNFNCDSNEWERFVNEGIQDGELIGDFTKMTKKFGRAYLTYLNASYLAKDEMNDSEFVALHGIQEKFLMKFK